MKISLIILFLLVLVYNGFSQSVITLNGTISLPIYHKFNDRTEEFKSQGGNVRSLSGRLGIDVKVFHKNRFFLKTGLNFKYQDVRMEDVFSSYTYWYPTKHGGYQITHHYTDKPDYIAKSRNIGLVLEGHFTTFEAIKWRGDVGIATNIYFFEFYKEYYYSVDKDLSAPSSGSEIGYPATAYPNRIKPFQITSTELTVFYQINGLVEKNFDIGLRAEVGTNLYSQWNSFRSYVWCGLGLHFGFGKTKYRTRE